MEQKLAYNVVFSNHINNKKSAQQVGLGYQEVVGLIRCSKKNFYLKNSPNEPKIDFMEQKMAYNILFLNHRICPKTSWYPRTTCGAFFQFEKKLSMPVSALYSPLWVQLGCFFGNYSFWSTKSARKPPPFLFANDMI